MPPCSYRMGRDRQSTRQRFEQSRLASPILRPAPFLDGPRRPEAAVQSLLDNSGNCYSAARTRRRLTLIVSGSEAGRRVEAASSQTWASCFKGTRTSAECASRAHLKHSSAIARYSAAVFIEHDPAGGKIDLQLSADLSVLGPTQRRSYQQGGGKRRAGTLGSGSSLHPDDAKSRIKVNMDV
jgi:hypothetical protein